MEALTTVVGCGRVCRQLPTAPPVFNIARHPLIFASFRVVRVYSSSSSSIDEFPCVDGILPATPNLHGKSPRKSWNAASLAFLGDSVWELYVRRKFFHPPSRVSDYYAAVVGEVRAESQAESYNALIAGTILSDEERDVLRWGRNATGTSPRRFGQGGPSKETYKAATAIECLVGFLYLTDAVRLHTVMRHLGMEGPMDNATENST